MSTPALACQFSEHSPSRSAQRQLYPCSASLQNISVQRCTDGTCVSANNARRARKKSLS